MLLLVALSALLAGCDVPTTSPIIETRWRFPTEPLDVPITGLSATSISTRDMSDIDLADKIRSGTILVTPRNATNATGTVTFILSGGGVTVQGTVDIAGGPDQAIPMTGPQIQAMLGGVVTFRATGTLCPASGCGAVAPPFNSVSLESELEVVVEVGGEG
jgi:hypothetical protein